jgi:opacity protein-like surface antigen
VLLGITWAGVASAQRTIADDTTDDRVRAAEQRARVAEERARAAEANTRVAGRPQTVDREDRRLEGETYVGGFLGYTLGHSFSSPAATGVISGANFGNTGIDLANSLAYGAKVGYFLPDRMRWLGFEVEAFNTTPNIRQHSENSPGQATSEGSYLRVTTLAFNAIARGHYGCRAADPQARRTTDTRYSGDQEFCPIQPYVGVGLGVFFARAKDRDGSSSDNGVPGLNVLAGIRYFVTERMAVFGEYKYNRASFRFPTIDTSAAGVPGGFDGTYSASMFTGGVSYHF